MLTIELNKFDMNPLSVGRSVTMSARTEILFEVDSIFDNKNASIGAQLKKLMGCESRYFSLPPDDNSPSDDVKSWNFSFEVKWRNALQGKNLEAVIADATEDFDGENKKDYTNSTLLHYACRVGAHRSLAYMLDEIDNDSMASDKKKALIDKVTHRCTSDCKPDSDVHADNHENKGGTALLVSLTTR